MYYPKRVWIKWEKIFKTIHGGPPISHETKKAVRGNAIGEGGMVLREVLVKRRLKKEVGCSPCVWSAVHNTMPLRNLLEDAHDHRRTELKMCVRK